MNLQDDIHQHIAGTKGIAVRFLLCPMKQLKYLAIRTAKTGRSFIYQRGISSSGMFFPHGMHEQTDIKLDSQYPQRLSHTGNLIQMMSIQTEKGILLNGMQNPVHQNIAIPL